MIKIVKYILIVIIFTIISCVKEEVVTIKDDTTPKKEDPPTIENNNSKTEIDEEVKVWNVQFSRTVAEELRKQYSTKKINEIVTSSLQLNENLKNLKIKTVYPVINIDPRFPKRTRKSGLDRWFTIEYESTTTTRAKDDLSAIEGVEHICIDANITLRGENNYISTKAQNNINAVYTQPTVQLQSTDLFSFNDLLNYKQWNLNIYANYNTCVVPVWQYYTTGSPSVVVAIIDSGVDLNHKDLAWNSIPAQEGGSAAYIYQPGKNDRQGTEAFKPIYEIIPAKHGTHVAGIIAAVNNNKLGVSSIAGGNFYSNKKGVKIMSMEIIREYKDDNNKDQHRKNETYQAIYDAANNGAVLCNNSWGYSPDSDGNKKISDEEKNAYKELFEDFQNNKNSFKLFKDVIDYFVENAGCDDNGQQLSTSLMKGGLVFFAAGNDNIAYDVPASYYNIVAVGAIDQNGTKASFSNYGDWVDICAPGQDIWSTGINNSYDRMHGTSMACPNVTGIAALVLSYRGHQGFTKDSLKNCLLQGARHNFPGANSNIGPLVNALGAIEYNTLDVPSTPQYTYTVKQNDIELKWKAVANSKGVVAKNYYVLWSNNKQDLENIDPLNIPNGIYSKNIVLQQNKGLGADMQCLVKINNTSKPIYVTVVAISPSYIRHSKFNISTITF